MSPPGETLNRRTRIVLEGVTGAGKSSVIGAMRESGQLPACFVTEDETFGDAMLEVGQPGFRRRLTEVCARFATGPTGQGLPEEILIERFHLSYYPQEPVRSRPPVNLLGAASRETAGSLPEEPDWSPYRVFDDWLLDGEFSVVVLVISEERLRERSLLRREFGGTDWQGFVPHFGSEANALEALRTSQARRIQALEKSRVRSLVVNTDSEAWASIAAQIAAFGTR